jgi:selenocysteine-specific elongation factor
VSTVSLQNALPIFAADDGVMAQTLGHVAMLRALRVDAGVVAVTKADLADPAQAARQAAELVPGAEIVACSARTRAGVDDVLAALQRVAARMAGRAGGAGDALLHIDRSFAVRGAGTVVTGTLWSGSLGRGDVLALLPQGRRVRVRGVQVHDEAVERAQAGQRVAVNLTGVEVSAARRGDALAAPGTVRPTTVLDAALDLRDGAHSARVHVHHGTREAPGRLAALGDGLWQLRLERPLLARDGDRVVVRAVAPPDTLGGGVVLDAAARRHGPRPDLVAALERRRRGEPEPRPQPPPGAPARTAPAPAAPPPLTPEALALERRLRAAAHEPPSDAELGAAAAQLPALRAAGRAVRVGRSLHAHPDAIAAVRERVTAIVESEGAVTLARLRDELGTSRRYAQALLEHLDSVHVTVRRADDSRVLRRRAASG